MILKPRKPVEAAQDNCSQTQRTNSDNVLQNLTGPDIFLEWLQSFFLLARNSVTLGFEFILEAGQLFINNKF